MKEIDTNNIKVKSEFEPNKVIQKDEVEVVILAFKSD